MTQNQNQDQALPPGWRTVKNVTGSVWYLDPNDVVHESLPNTEMMGALLQIASLRQGIPFPFFCHFSSFSPT